MFERIKKTKSYKKANSRAEDYAKDPKKLNELINKASDKAEKNTNGPLLDLRDNLTVIFRLLKAYSKRQYTKMPWQSLTLIIGSVAYFAMPIDMIPDMLAGLGLADDITLLAYTIKAAKADIEDFKEWEEENINR